MSNQPADSLQQKLKAFERTLNIMDDLRAKCPWDKKQTIDSLRILTIEETYELCDAILQKDPKGLKEELGDLLLHIVFYSKIASETGDFDIADVMNTLCDKLIERHPHIYGDVMAETDEQVKQNWEQIKQKNTKRSLLAGVPVSLPAIVKAYRMQEKAKQVGFEWENKAQVWEKVDEELNEFKEEAFANEISKEKIEKEFGDLLFSLVNLSRFLNIDPEAALEKTNLKFRNRFMLMEQMAEEKEKKLHEMNLPEMDALWNETKKQVP
ncbi:MAG TPA: nucleoside triphosphate pyrophosphohydrolase [Bacteroidetes bacterium]|nr:nucleoside triphosphate pyrophosphohydrolase [Bacteroidota bacterium]